MPKKEGVKKMESRKSVTLTNGQARIKNWKQLNQQSFTISEWNTQSFKTFLTVRVIPFFFLFGCDKIICQRMQIVSPAKKCKLPRSVKVPPFRSSIVFANCGSPKIGLGSRGPAMCDFFSAFPQALMKIQP